MSDLKQRIERILELRSKAIEGPWKRKGVDVFASEWCESHPITSCFWGSGCLLEFEAEDNADFIASSHDMANLLAELLPMVDDARRYQYLRQAHDRQPDEISARVWLGGSELDAAIDAQMNKENTND